MQCLLACIISLLLLLILRNNSSVESIDIQSIQKDIDEFNMTCNEDKCGNHLSDSIGYRHCHCGIQCAQLGSCCVDSPYVDVPQPKLKRTCRSVYNGGAYFIVDDCPSDSAWASLCNAEWNKDQDIQKLVPVTSNSTSITYKNFFCFRCHEKHDEFMYWRLKIKSNSVEDHKIKFVARRLDEHRSFTYNKDMDTWMVTYDEDIGYFPVNITVFVPFDAFNLAYNYCEPFISDCSEEWSDEEVRNKCHSYMSMKEVEKHGVKLIYKNVHCALCNFESLNSVFCKTMVARLRPGELPFSFTHVLDINPSDGELVGKRQNCENDEFWDNAFQKCKKLKCVLPGYKIKNDKCVQE